MKIIDALKVALKNPQIFKCGMIGLFLIFFSVIQTANLQSETPAALYAGKVTALACNPDDPAIVVCAFQRKGLLLSEDAGLHWHDISTPPVGAVILSLALPDAQHILVGGDQGAAISEDQGENWRIINRQKTYDVEWRNPSPGKIYLAGHYGLIASDDLGATWDNLTKKIRPRGIIVRTFEMTAQSSDKIIIGTLGDGLYVSSNSGLSWNQVSEDFPPFIQAVGSSSTHPDRLIVAANNEYRPHLITSGVVYISYNAGMSWHSVEEWIRLHDVAFDKADPDHCYVASQNLSLHHSTDGGLNFRKDADGITSNRIHCVISPGDYVLVGTDDGLFRRYGHSGDFQKIEIKAGCVNHIRFHRTDPSFVYAALDGGLYVSIDSGIHWHRTGYGINKRRMDIKHISCTMDGARLLAATSGDGILHSEDFGLTWHRSLIQNMGDWAHFRDFAFSPSDYNKIFASGFSHGVYVSHDKGLQWQKVADYTVESSCIAVNPFNAAEILSGTYSKHIYKSSDHGASWKQVLLHDLHEYSPVYDIDYHPSIPGFVFAVGEGGLYRSFDAGNSWNRLTTDCGLPGNPLTLETCFSPCGSRYYTVIQGKGIYYTSDLGTNFHLFSDDLSEQFINCITVDPENPQRILTGAAGEGISILP